MALKDPPSYVGLDPALIYGIHDLRQVTYQRLLQLIGWMWVTRKSGNPLGTSVEELAGRWGIAERTVYHTLQILADKGYIEVQYNRNMAFITKGQQCYNRPGEPAHTQHSGEAGTQQAAGSGTHNTPGEPVQGSANSRANILHDDANKLHGPNSISGVVVGSDPDQDLGSLQLQQPTSKSVAQLSMEQAGMFEDKAAELACDPWVTEQRIQNWMEQLLKDKSVRNIGAVLYSNLKAHRQPQTSREQQKYWNDLVEKQNRRRRNEGWNICPDCWMHPCHCDELNIVKEPTHDARHD